MELSLEITKLPLKKRNKTLLKTCIYFRIYETIFSSTTANNFKLLAIYIYPKTTK